MTEDATRLSADVLIEHGDWPEVELLINKCFEGVIIENPQSVYSAAISFLFTNDAIVQQLNATFRGFDKPTNVLSFPAAPEVPGAPESDPPFIGDIAVAYETCLREAEEKSIDLKDHLTHLILHGILHLFGYDHQEEHDAVVMERLETDILRHLDIADPYAETEI